MKTIIHGGLHKTGSTSLQAILSNSYLKLNEHRILYPSLHPGTSHFTCHHSIAFNLYSTEIQHKFKQYRDGPTLDDIKIQISSSKPDYLILSSEGFSQPLVEDINLERSELISYLANVSDQIHFIAFVRSPICLAHSAYTEGVTNMMNYLTFGDQTSLAIEDPLSYDNLVKNYDFYSRFLPWINLDNIRLSVVNLSDPKRAKSLNIAEQLLEVAGFSPSFVKQLELRNIKPLNINPGMLTIAALRYSIPHIYTSLHKVKITDLKEFVYSKAEMNGWIKNKYNGIDQITCLRFAHLFDTKNVHFYQKFGFGSNAGLSSIDFLANYDKKLEPCNDIDLSALTEPQKSMFDGFLFELLSFINMPPAI
jgi:hypothetical protein